MKIKIKDESEVESLFKILRSLKVKELPHSEAQEYLDPSIRFATPILLKILCEYKDDILTIVLIGERTLVLNGKAYRTVDNVHEQLVEYLKSIGAVKDDPTRYVVPQ